MDATHSSRGFVRRLHLAPQPRPSSAFSQPPGSDRTPRLPICRSRGPAMPIMHRGLCLVIIVLLNIPTSSCFLSSGLARLTRRSCAATGRRGASLCRLRAQADGADGGEWALTNDQCDLLELPRGTKMVLTPPNQIHPLLVIHLTRGRDAGVSAVGWGARVHLCVWGLEVSLEGATSFRMTRRRAPTDFPRGFKGLTFDPKSDPPTMH